MKKVLFILLSLAVAAGLNAQIAGSAHDFSTETWTTDSRICLPCHTPHGADMTVSDAPLWNHDVTVDTYTLYSSSTLNATMTQPAGVSKLCLSCHDGTVALDSFGGATGTDFIATPITTLESEHPVSFTYDTALATADGGLHDPSSTPAVAALLFSGEMECASCHDVHNADGNTYLLRVDNAGSALCLTCHDK